MFFLLTSSARVSDSDQSINVYIIFIQEGNSLLFSKREGALGQCL